MIFTIQFDGKSFLYTNKVNDVVLNYMLSSEVIS